MTTMVDEKTCTRCGRSKPTDQFNRMTKAPDGLAYYCRPCDRESSRARYRSATAEARESFRQYRERIKAKVIEHYGGCCAACSAITDLEVDHVNGDGEQHRRELTGRARAGGHAFRQALVAAGFETDKYKLQLLCLGCHKEKTRWERGQK